MFNYFFCNIYFNDVGVTSVSDDIRQWGACSIGSVNAYNITKLLSCFVTKLNKFSII